MMLWLFLLLATQLSAQHPNWETLTTAGMQAYHDGRYDEASDHLRAALAMADRLPPQDPRVAKSLINLATLLQARRQFAQAAPLLQRALQFREQALGAKHPDVAEVLEVYVALLHQQYPWKSRLPWSKAAKMADRAKRIRQRTETASQGTEADDAIDRWRWPDDERELFGDSDA